MMMMGKMTMVMIKIMVTTMLMSEDDGNNFNNHNSNNNKHNTPITSDKITAQYDPASSQSHAGS